MCKTDKMFLDIAEIIAQQSKCVSFQIGALLVLDGRIISNGRNGTPSKFINCNEKFNIDDFNRDEHHEWSNKFEVHAEMNALMFALRHGISTNGATLYSTYQPCHNCLKHIISAGIVEIVYRYDYDKCGYSDATFALLDGTNVILRKEDV